MCHRVRQHGRVIQVPRACHVQHPVSVHEGRTSGVARITERLAHRTGPGRSRPDDQVDGESVARVLDGQVGPQDLDSDLAGRSAPLVFSPHSRSRVTFRCHRTGPRRSSADLRSGPPAPQKSGANRQILRNRWRTTWSLCLGGVIARPPLGREATRATGNCHRAETGVESGRSGSVSERNSAPFGMERGRRGGTRPTDPLGASGAAAHSPTVHARRTRRPQPPGHGVGERGLPAGRGRQAGHWQNGRTSSAMTAT